MDRIMPIDLERAKLRKSIRGYSAKEVDKLLHDTALTLQELLVDNDHLRRELDSQKAELQRVRSQEDTLKEALLLAQKAADDTRTAAQVQASVIMEEARQSAQGERVAAQQKLTEMRWEIERLKIERQKFSEDFRAMLDRYGRDLDFLGSLTVVEGEAEEAEPEPEQIGA
jgi:cell division initiation protein